MTSQPKVTLRRRATGLSARGSAAAALILAMVPVSLVSLVSLASAAELVERDLSLDVQNVNRSDFSCDSDGRSYQVEGHLVGPRRALQDRSPAVTVLVHGAETTSDYMRFDAVRGYDLQDALAKRGRLTVTFDRLGYGDSGRPRGDRVCYGSQADVLHQVVTGLRSGRYRTSGGPSSKFGHVAMAAHSVGTPIAEIEAASFADVDALVAMSWGAPDVAEILPDLATSEAGRCPVGGAGLSGGPRGYAYQWPNATRYEHDVFYDPAPRVLRAAGGLRRRSPCGDILSNVPMTLQEPELAGRVDVPVLVMIGDRDALFPPPAGPRQLSLFKASPDRSLITIPRTGHTIFLERQAPRVQRELSDWLARRGF